jgi:hypothetical protein
MTNKLLMERKKRKEEMFKKVIGQQSIGSFLSKK